ncbi:MAG TPA: HEAT repeat domain-containing protein [Planctomycetota bacterium]|nr:HEAT repeat domain-containing protein [Planctomycetota bacterium]
MRIPAARNFFAAGLFFAGGAFGQAPVDDWEAPFAAAARPRTGAAVDEELNTLFRLVTKAGGVDRVDVRARMMLLGREGVLPLCAVVESGSHLYSRTASLVLGEMRDARATPALLRAVGGASRGDPVAAALALGRLGSPAALSALTVQAASSRSRQARTAAALALGRLGVPEATGRLRDLLADARLDSDDIAYVTALGLTGDHGAAEILPPFLRSKVDRVRRAAVAAAAAIGAPALAEALADAVKDEDVEVRTAALEGLARIGGPDLVASPAVLAAARSTDAAVRAAAVLATTARGGAGAEAFALRHLDDPSEKVRAAAAAGLAAAATTSERAEVVLQRGLADRHADVRRAAAAATAIFGGRTGRNVSVAAFVGDRDAGVRETAILAEAWLRGDAARPWLQSVVDARKEDRVVETARLALRALEEPEGLAHRILRARLQVILDDAGVAPSWNPLARLNRLVIEALGVEDALPEETPKSAGAPATGGAGGGGGGEDRPKVRRRPPPEQEDLRRHLERHPYADRRDAVETPLLR